MSFVEVDDLLSQAVDGVLEIGTNKRRVVTVLVRLLQIFFKVSSEFQLVFPPVKKRALERVAAGVGYVRELPEARCTFSKVKDTYIFRVLFKAKAN